MGGRISVLQSPLPALYWENIANPEGFIQAATLVSALWLVLSGTVVEIIRLNFSLQSNHQLAVDFEGRRAEVYSNVPATIVSVKGICNLYSCEAVLKNIPPSVMSGAAHSLARNGYFLVSDFPELDSEVCEDCIHEIQSNFQKLGYDVSDLELISFPGEKRNYGIFNPHRIEVSEIPVKER